MALDIQIPYRGDQYLYQGISSAGASLGAGLQKAIQQSRHQQDMGTQADYFMKAMGMMGGPNAMPGISGWGAGAGAGFGGSLSNMGVGMPQ